MDLTNVSSGLRAVLKSRNYAGQSTLFFRINGPDGPVLARRSMQAVIVRLLTGALLPLMHTYPDGSRLIGASLKMVPVMPDVGIKLTGISGEMIFDGVGMSDMIVHGSDFDEFGQFNYVIIGTASGCHNIKILDRADQ
jgi:hypothetical protein